MQVSETADELNVVVTSRGRRTRAIVILAAGVLLVPALWVVTIGWIGSIVASLLGFVLTGLFAATAWPALVWVGNRIKIRIADGSLVSSHHPREAFWTTEVALADLVDVWAARASTSSSLFGQYVLRAQFKENQRVTTVVEGLESPAEASALEQLIRRRMGLAERPTQPSLLDDADAAKSKHPALGWLLSAGAVVALGGGLLAISLLTNQGTELGRLALSDDYQSMKVRAHRGALHLAFYLEVNTNESTQFAVHDFDVLVEVTKGDASVWSGRCGAEGGVYLYQRRSPKGREDKLRLADCYVELPKAGRYAVRAKRVWINEGERSKHRTTTLCPTVYDSRSSAGF
jgi:hypothetical protein